ncbi:hypothetical protein ACIBO2_23550 [Nonomuraea sp. NPDC050022]|uniref:hypothetical protein n=1 Tax=unclassified Nonomuraea TaxID=2593643 RepID=UPI003407AE19
MINAIMGIVTPTPGALQDGDLFKAPIPDEFFPIKSYADSLDEPTFTEQVVAWLPVLAGVAAGVVLGVVITLIILRRAAGSSN